MNVTVSFSVKEKSNRTLKAILSSADRILAVKLNIRSGTNPPWCPPGFELDEHGICSCGKAVQKFYNATNYYGKETCDINALSIFKPNYIAAPWIGMLTDKKQHNVVGITDLCPFECCMTDFSMDRLAYNTTTDQFQLTNSHHSHVDMCRENREGILCGSCIDGYSVVFGSSSCQRCSNWWIFTILFYAAIGPLIIYILYTLDLTITAGTINGILFYAQASNVGVLPFLNYFPNIYIKQYLFQ